MSIQLAALGIAIAVILAFVLASRARSAWARRAAGHELLPPTGAPYVLYFGGENCSTCKTLQEPALDQLHDIEVRKLDAVRERDLARRFHVYTVPTTIVVSADGRARHLNYGYAPAAKLQRQLADAGPGELATA